MILMVSLELFNQLGESNVTSVDIANELDISPGNLYYHFKGKEEIIAALVRRFAAELDAILAATQAWEKTLLGQWLLVYLVLERVYANRFFFRNIPDILYNYPESGKLLLKILEQLKGSFTGFITLLAEREEIGISTVQKNLISKLVKSIMLVVIYWESYQVLNRQQVAEIEFVQDAGLQILSLITPYLSDDRIRDIHQLHQQYLRDKITPALEAINPV